MQRIKPIKPEEVGSAKEIYFPDMLIKTVNDLIARNFSEGKAKVLKKDIVRELVLQGYTHEEISRRHLLDFEEIYCAAGWTVFYEAPVGYADEHFEACYTFTPSSTPNRKES